MPKRRESSEISGTESIKRVRCDAEEYNVWRDIQSDWFMIILDDADAVDVVNCSLVCIRWRRMILSRQEILVKRYLQREFGADLESSRWKTDNKKTTNALGIVDVFTISFLTVCLKMKAATNNNWQEACNCEERESCKIMNTHHRKVVLEKGQVLHTSTYGLGAIGTCPYAFPILQRAMYFPMQHILVLGFHQDDVNLVWTQILTFTKGFIKHRNLADEDVQSCTLINGSQITFIADRYYRGGNGYIIHGLPCLLETPEKKQDLVVICCQGHCNFLNVMFQYQEEILDTDVMVFTSMFRFENGMEDWVNKLPQKNKTQEVYSLLNHWNGCILPPSRLNV